MSLYPQVLPTNPSVDRCGIKEVAAQIMALRLEEARARIAANPAEHRARMRELDRASDEAAEQREQLRIYGLPTWEFDCDD